MSMWECQCGYLWMWSLWYWNGWIKKASTTTSTIAWASTSCTPRWSTSWFRKYEEEEETNLSHHGQKWHIFHEDYGVKVDIPDFEGQLHVDDFIDWLAMVERVCDLKDIPKTKKVELVAIKLKKHASIWWENFKKGREC